MKGLWGTRLVECSRRKMKKKEHLNEERRNESSKTNLSCSEECRDAGTGMTRRTPRAKTDVEEGQSSQKEDGHQQDFRAE